MYFSPGLPFQLFKSIIENFQTDLFEPYMDLRVIKKKRKTPYSPELEKWDLTPICYLFSYPERPIYVI